MFDVCDDETHKLVGKTFDTSKTKELDLWASTQLDLQAQLYFYKAEIEGKLEVVLTDEM